jgi:hypothetical protein
LALSYYERKKLASITATKNGFFSGIGRPLIWNFSMSRTWCKFAFIPKESQWLASLRCRNLPGLKKSQQPTK